MFRRARLSLRAGLLLVAVSVSLAVSADEFVRGTLIISDAWSRATAPGVPMGVAYFTVTNQGKNADTLVGASSPAAESVELHQSTIADGMARMRPVAEIPIPAGATVKIEPGGVHLMLVGLKRPFESGGSVPLVLEFRQAGSVTVALRVRSPSEP